MKTLATMLTELMRADAVPMSDGWGQLHDRLLKIDQTMSEIYEPVKVPTSPVYQGLITASGAQAAMYSKKAMWTCPSCGTLRDQVGMDNTPPICGCGRFMHLDVYPSNTRAIEMPILDNPVCSAELAAEGKPYPETCAVHGLYTKCPPLKHHNWILTEGGRRQRCSGCGCDANGPAIPPKFCPGNLDL